MLIRIQYWPALFLILFFEVDDAQGLANQVRALEDVTIRRVMIEKSSPNVQQFSWKNSAKELFSFINVLKKA